MELNAYFDFISDDDIRLAGTRIGIETILSHYLNGVAPETLAEWYPELSLDQIFATLTYYFANCAAVDAYLADLDAWFDGEWQQQQQNPSPVRQRLMHLQRQQQLTRAGTSQRTHHIHSPRLANSQDAVEFTMEVTTLTS